MANNKEHPSNTEVDESLETGHKRPTEFGWWANGAQILA